MKYKILLPVTNNPGFVHRMVDLLRGHEKDLIVVNNWKDDDVHLICQGFCNRGAEVWDCRFNLGLAATWNLGLQRMAEDDCDFLIVLSPSVIFTKPFQLFIDEVIKAETANPNRYSQYLSDYTVNLHCFVRTRLGHKLIGYYDENFWPIYHEDTDLCVRQLVQQKTGEHPFEMMKLECDFISTQGYSLSCAASLELMHLFQSNSQRHLEYFRKKWGCDYGGKHYDHPFNNPNIHFNKWEFQPDFTDPSAAHQPLQRYTPEST